MASCRKVIQDGRLLSELYADIYSDISGDEVSDREIFDSAVTKSSGK
jgi:hypothetical protein